MNRRSLIWIPATFAMAAVSPALADYRISISGDDLLTLCRGIDLDTKRPLAGAQMECLRYIEGVADLWGKLRTFSAVGPGPFDIDFCLPTGGVRGSLMVTIVADYLSALPTPERVADGASTFVIPALARAFPCQ